jgi:hypothetical protein
MNATVADAIAAYVAELEAVAETPLAPFGFGTDIACTTDIPETFPDVDPSSTRALGEALVRRLDCPRGALPDDADYGIDVRSMLNTGATSTEIRTLAGRIRAELSKDDRVDSVAVTVTVLTSNASEIRIEILVVAVDPSLGRFSLTLAATPATILIEELRAA